MTAGDTIPIVMTYDKPAAKAAKNVNRLCRAGLNAGIVALFASPLAVVIPANADRRPHEGWNLQSLLWGSGCEIVLAGVAIGICVVGLFRVIRNRGVESGIGMACGGIGASLTGIMVASLPWLWVWTCLHMPIPS